MRKARLCPRQTAAGRDPVRTPDHEQICPVPMSRQTPNGVIADYRNDFLQRPHPIRQPRGHRWRVALQRGVLAAEVVVGGREAHHRGVVRGLLGVGIREAGHAAVLHPNREVEPLAEAGADLGFVRVSEADDLLHAGYLRGRIPRLLLLALVGFHQLGEVAPRTKCHRNLVRVEGQAVRGHLAVAYGGVVEAAKERIAG